MSTAPRGYSYVSSVKSKPGDWFVEILRDKDLCGRGQLEIGTLNVYSGLLVFYYHSRMSAGIKSGIIHLGEVLIYSYKDTDL